MTSACCSATRRARWSGSRDSLIQKGLIWSPRRSQVDFTVPLFAEFLLEHHPIGGFGDE